jgi:hypothetical protein
VDVCLLRVLRVVKYRFLRRADHSSRGVLPNVMCPSVIDELHKGSLGPLRLMRREKESKSSLTPKQDRSQGRMQTKCPTMKGKRGLLRRKHAPKSQQSPPVCCYVLPLLLKWLFQHSIFGHPLSVFYSHCERPSFTSTQINKKCIHPNVSIFIFLESKTERQNVLHWIVSNILWRKYGVAQKERMFFIYLHAISFFGVTSNQKSTFENLV